jgi:hypothetical protein
MFPWLLVPGLALVGLAVFDALRTTLGRGGGPLTRLVSRSVWRLTRSRPGRRVSGYLFRQLGVVVLLAVVTVWVVFLWGGWSLVFLASDAAVVSATTGLPADAWSRVYFAGYTLVTLGLGDFRPVGAPWQLLTTATALSGLFVFTLAISYVLPVLQAALHRRATASALWGLGETPQEVIRHMWRTDRGCSALEQHLIGLTPDLTLLAQQHIAYPVLHHFHGDSRREALAPSLAVLDEALSVIEHGLDADCLGPDALRPARAAVSTLLNRLESQSVDPSDEPPPPPSLAGLRREGYPVRTDAAFREALREDACDRRRRLLLGLVRAEGWDWDHVLDDEPADDDPPDDGAPRANGAARPYPAERTGAYEEVSDA